MIPSKRKSRELSDGTKRPTWGSGVPPDGSTSSRERLIGIVDPQKSLLWGRYSPLGRRQKVDPATPSTQVLAYRLIWSRSVGSGRDRRTLIAAALMLVRM